MGASRLLLTAGLAAAIALSGCGDGGDGTGAEVTVSATTTHVADLTRHVGGRRADVRPILRPGSDPHDYEPRPSDVRRVAEADLVLRSGGEVDEWLEDFLDQAGGEARSVTLIEFVDTIEGEGDDPDPHWWQDPVQAIRAVGAIARALADADPGGRAVYERNADRYTARLRRLDREIARCMALIPEGKRKLVTTHDALGYFARRYDVDVIGAVIPALSTQAQASAKEVEELVDQIREEGVEAIFPETGLSPKLEKAVSREAGAKVGKSLWADALGPEGSAGETYLEAMASNTEALVEGMTGGRRSCRPTVRD